jgi:hypothetical protein
LPQARKFAGNGWRLAGGFFLSYANFIHMDHTCLNCQVSTGAGDRFCRACGQSTSTHRLNATHIVHEFTHAFTHTDKSILYLIVHLFTKPGYIARAYVDGQRKRLYNPFSFLVILVAICVFAMHTSEARIFGDTANPASAFMSKHFNLVIFFTVPMAAFHTWLFFRKKGVNFAECCVLATYTAGERTVVFNLVVIPLIWLFPAQQFAVIYTYLAVFAVYYAVACMQFTGSFRTGTFLKGVLVTFLLQATIVVLVAIGLMCYYMLR